MKPSKISVYNKSRSGHRGSYFDFFSSIFSCHEVGPLKALTSSDPVLFLMIEDVFSLYVATAVFRSLLGRRTVGLLFRPGPAMEGASLRLKVKKVVLKGLKALPQVRTLTIVPFSVAPEFSNIADDGIYDLQLWDMSTEKLDHSDRGDPHLIAELRNASVSRTILSALGTQGINKGYDVFTALWLENPELRHRALFASAGQVSAPLSTLSKQFELEGGFSLNRYVSDEELISFYLISDLIWCYYDRNYDQASGILGRAVQFGIPVIVRPGSISHTFCKIEGVPHISGDAQLLGKALAGDLPARDDKLGRTLSRRFRQISLEKLQDALDV